MPQAPPTLSWGDSPSTFLPQAQQAALDLWHQILRTPQGLRRAFSYDTPGGMTGAGQGMQGVSDMGAAGARNIAELVKQFRGLSGPSVADVARGRR